jgi:hypothetical protein
VIVGPLLHDGSRAEVVTENFPPLRLCHGPKRKSPALLGFGDKTHEIESEDLLGLFEAFVACRTTLDDLSTRAALGEDLSGPVIAAHLSCISAQKHNVVATVINARLSELSMPAAAPYTDRHSTS